MTAGTFLVQTQFMTELLVSGSGRLRVIDFNTATVNGSYTCAAGIRSTALPKAIDRYFAPSLDADIMKVLDAMFIVNRTLQSYNKSGVPARPGICRLPQNLSALQKGVPSQDLMQRCEQGGSAAEKRKAPTGTFALPGPGGRRGQKGLRSLPSASNPMPAMSDIRECLSRCRACSRCAYVSVSSARRACLWCADAWLGGLWTLRREAGLELGARGGCQQRAAFLIWQVRLIAELLEW
jgi:hypothetical protein